MNVLDANAGGREDAIRRVEAPLAEHACDIPLDRNLAGGIGDVAARGAFALELGTSREIDALPGRDIRLPSGAEPA